VNASPTRLLLVLHGHLPDVTGHGTWPHGVNWLYEAAAETYIPFLRIADQLLAEGTPFCATVGMTPVLCEQLQDERFKRGFRWYLRQRARAAEEDRDRFSAAGDAAMADLAEKWRGHYREVRRDFEEVRGRDLLAEFRRLAEMGVIEPIASAATHGFLPLLPNDRAVERQLDVGLRAHARHFGKPARGIWLPECAYRPTGLWLSPADGRLERRPGIEEFLAARGVSFFFVETHLVKGGVTLPAYGGRVEREDEGQSPYRIHAVRAESGAEVAVFARDPLSSQQVWSGIVGYPGDARYLEFHKKSAPSGHRYWSVTDSKLDLHEKVRYAPETIPAAVESHAEHFVSLLEKVPRFADGAPPVVVAMFDFELFGHWWFEGLGFLREVFRRVSRSETVTTATASAALAALPPVDAISMPPGTWGRNGDFQVWWNGDTVPYWQKVDEAERRMEAFEERRETIPPELFEALERQTLLLQSSDWPFLIDNEAAKDYAEARIAGHYRDFGRLADMAESGNVDSAFLEDLSRRDHLFGPELKSLAAR